jgi:hypothetical protein
MFEQQERALEGKKKFRRKEEKRISEVQGCRAVIHRCYIRSVSISSS